MFRLLWAWCFCPVLAGVILLVPSAALAVKNGDAVVIKQDADLKVSGKVVGHVKAGEVSRVHGVRGVWVEVGDKTRGWVRTENVLDEQDAVQHISKLIEASPDDASLWITRSKMRLSTEGIHGPELSRRLQAAETDLSEAQQHEPDNAEVCYYQAVLALRRNDRESALAKLNEAIRLNGQDARFFADRGWLLWQRDQKPEAMQDFEKVVGLKQADAAIYNNLAWWHATNYDSTVLDGAKAVKYATEACELTHYNNYMYIDTLAAAYAESNDFRSAIRWEEEAISKCNDSTVKRQCEARLKQYRLNQPYREFN